MLFGLLILFWCTCIIQGAYLVWYHLTVQQLSQSNTSGTPATKSISVVICARNEAARLPQIISDICNQDYPAPLFEVLVVNDNSTDTTASLLQQLAHRYPALRVIDNTSANLLKGKKAALDLGIRQAKYDFILLTDADCRPAGKNWIRSMSAYPANHIVLGYGPYFPENTFLNKWVRWETLHTFIQYTSYAKSNRPYMGVGRNMLYPKQMYLDAMQDSGFLKTYNSLPSGDDDLLLQQFTAQGHPPAINSDKESFMYSPAPATWKALFRQKSRHISTGKYYRSASRNLLGIYGITHSAFWFLFVTGILLLLAGTVSGTSTNSFSPYAMAALLLVPATCRFALVWLVFKNYNTFTQTFDHNRFYITGDLLWSCYNTLLAPFIFFKNKQQWK